MSDFGLDLKGSDTRVTLRFEKFPQGVHDRLFATLTSLEQRLESMVIAAVPRDTGTLASLVGGRVYDHEARMAAVVGVRAPDQRQAVIAATQEYGSHRSITVRAHEATLSRLFGRAVSPVTVQVGVHQRLTNIDPRRFLRGPIEAIHGQAITELRAAVMQALGTT
jgi:hypothetical protein